MKCILGNVRKGNRLPIVAFATEYTDSKDGDLPDSSNTTRRMILNINPRLITD